MQTIRSASDNTNFISYIGRETNEEKTNSYVFHANNDYDCMFIWGWMRG